MYWAWCRTGGGGGIAKLSPIALLPTRYPCRVIPVRRRLVEGEGYWPLEPRSLGSFLTKQWFPKELQFLLALTTGHSDWG